MALFIKILFGGLVVAYPFAVFFGLQHFSLRQVAAVLMVLFVVRLFLQKTPVKDANATSQSRDVVKVANFLAVSIGLALLAAVLIFDQSLLLKFYPLVVSLVMLLAFGWTLLNPPSAIERIARKLDPDLSELGVIHTRQVTYVWCLFFVVNGAVSAYTALFSSMEVWMLYNGLVSYLIMGALFALEFVVRLIRKRLAGEL